MISHRAWVPYPKPHLKPRARLTEQHDFDAFDEANRITLDNMGAMTFEKGFKWALNMASISDLRSNLPTTRNSKGTSGSVERSSALGQMIGAWPMVPYGAWM